MNKNKTMLQIKEDKMKSTKEKIEVMQAYENGETLQLMLLDENLMLLDENPCWNDAIIKNKEPEFRWGEFDYRIKPKEPETDWSKVTKGTAVFVSYQRDVCDKDDEWVEAYFDYYDDGCFYVFDQISRVVSYDKCKLDKSAPSIINWIKNTGETPDCDHVLVRYIEGKIMYSNVIALCFNINDSGIVEYAIIE